MTAMPIAFTVTRYRCPHCPRTGSGKARIREHMGRCWYNPAAKGCKTCRHFDNTYADYAEDCNVGVDLTGRPACEACGGHRWADTSEGGERRCGPGVSRSHVGDGRKVKAGPIVGCDRWEATA